MTSIRFAVVLLLGVTLTAVAAPAPPRSLAFIEQELGDESLARLTLPEGAPQAVQTENEETAWWFGFSPEGVLFYAEGPRLRVDAQKDETPVLSLQLERSAVRPVALASGGRMAVITPVEVLLLRYRPEDHSLVEPKPVLLPSRCKGKDVLFSSDEKSLYVLCSTTSGPDTWLARVDAETGRGEHLYVKDGQRVLGAVKPRDVPLVVRADGKGEAVVVPALKGPPKVVYAAKPGERVVGLAAKRGELVVVAGEEAKRSLLRVKLGQSKARVWVKGLPVGDVSVSGAQEGVVLSLRAGSEEVKGDLGVLRWGDSSPRRVLRGDEKRGRLYRMPVSSP